MTKRAIRRRRRQAILPEIRSPAGSRLSHSLEAKLVNGNLAETCFYLDEQLNLLDRSIRGPDLQVNERAAFGWLWDAINEVNRRQIARGLRLA